MARNALDVAKDALAKWRANYGNASLDQQCQRYDGYYWQWAYQGNENIRAYPTATAAGNAASFYTYNINDPVIKPGHLVYWHWASDGHVGTVVGRHNGRTLVTHASSKGDTVLSLTNNVKVSHADTIGLTFRGVSRTDGGNAERVGLTAWSPDGSGGDVDYNWGLSAAAVRAMQRVLTKRKLYSGPIDGAAGENTVEGMQKLLIADGFLPKSYEVDGIPGLNYGRAIQVMVQPFGYSGPLDGMPGAETSKNLEKWAAKQLGETVTPPTKPVEPVRPVPAKWEKTYPASSAVVPSPNREPRKAGSKIGYVILHGTANPVDHTAYFARSNEREVAPNLYARPSGEVKEFVRLGERAWTTAVPLDHQAVTFEIESNNTTYTDAQYEALAQFCAWLSKQTVVDGVPVEFKLDRAHVLGHNEVPGVTSGTSCPGKLDIDRVVKRAQEIVKPTQLDQIVVTRKQLDAWRKALEDMSATGGNVLSEIGKVLEK